MIKKRISTIFIIVGIILVAISSLLFYQNSRMEYAAKTFSENTLQVIKAEMEDIEEENIYSQVEQDFQVEYEEIVVDGSLYTAILEIPALNLELPIQSSWSYEKLKNTPCIYQSKPLSIAAHNYQAHFGKLEELKIGDQATLTYVTGEVVTYQVVAVTKVYETDIEALEDEQYDLTLFTCNYNNNKERILVRLQKS